MTFTCFRGFGQCSSLIALNRFSIRLRSSGGIFCIMSGVTSSRPGALRGWRCFITPVSYSKVNARGFSVC
jgi:hypothetical protein